MRHLSVAEAAHRAGIKGLTVLRAIQSGQLPAVRTAGGDYEVDLTSLFRVLATIPRS
jgi:excisionase family DNA binding protein